MLLDSRDMIYEYGNSHYEVPYFMKIQLFDVFIPALYLFINDYLRIV